MSDHTFKIGDRFIIEGRGQGWDGITGVVADIDPSDECSLVLQYDDVDATPIKGAVKWTPNLYVKYAGQQSSDPDGKIVSHLTHQTSKDYAGQAVSARGLSGEHNAILASASRGEDFDVVEFRKAATAALSLASTRAGQSMQRRVFAKEARHLIHWADAIIDAHIESLPAYEQGERSRLVEQAKQSLAEAAEIAKSLEGERDAARSQARGAEREASRQSERANAFALDLRNVRDDRDKLLKEIEVRQDERNNLSAEIKGLREEVERAQRSEKVEANRATEWRKESERIDRLRERERKGYSNTIAGLTAERDRLTERCQRQAAEDVVLESSAVHKALDAASETESDRDRLADVLAYAIDQATPEQRERIFGYWDAKNEEV